MPVTIRIVSDLRAEVVGADELDEEAIAALDRKLSYPHPGARFMRYRRKGWDGRVHLLSQPGASFATGLVGLAKAALEGEGLKVRVDDAREAFRRSAGPSGVALWDPKDPKKPLTLRHYQKSALEAAWEGRRGIIKAPTGSGKTEIMSGLIQACGQTNTKLPKTIVLLHKRPLALQTQERLSAELAHPVGLVGMGRREPKQVTVVIVASLFAKGKGRSRKLKPEALQLLSECELLIIDECHNSSAMSWHKVVKACKARRRIGLSATPLNRSDGKDLLLIAVTGDVLYSISSKQLIDEGFLARPTVIFKEIHEPRGYENSDYKTAYEDCVVNNRAFHLQVREDIKHFVQQGKKVLVLVKRIKHGRKIAGKNLEFIHAKMEDEDIKDAIHRLDQGELLCLIASPVFGEGIDIPSVDVMITASGGKSIIETLQKAGRALRPKKGGNTAVILDYAHFENDYLLKHSLARFKTYQKEGWKITS